MSIEPPSPGVPRRPSGPRDPGDAWVVSPDGTRYWGRFGAAGLVAWDPGRGARGSVLLQHRVEWSHHGGTWGIPGGARHQGEEATTAAIREAREEAGVPEDSLNPLWTSVLDLGIWTYTTLVAEVAEPFEPVIADPESVALAWVAVDEVAELPLHPGFAAAWSVLRDGLPVRPVIVVDAANVVGSVPDGWWKDRAGAAQRLRERLNALAEEGMDASALGLSGSRWFIDSVLVVEGQARAMPELGGGAHAGPKPVRIVRAGAGGDDAIVEEVVSLVAEGRRVIGVTSDRALAERIEAEGAVVHGARWLLDQLPQQS